MPASANVTPRETDKFSALASVWWDPEGPMRSLHAVNLLRTTFIARAVDLSGIAALDVGCGGGLLAESMARGGASVTGIDLSKDLLALARSHAAEQHLVIEYLHTGAEQLAADHAGAFDVVTCMEVLEHIPRPVETIRACSRLLKPGGHAFFSTIDRSLKSFLFAIIGAEYVLGLLPRGSHSYGSLIKPAQLRRWANENSLELVNSGSLTYNLLARRFSLDQRLGVNYLMHFTRN